MKPLIDGKDEVLAFLENEALRLSDENPGLYNLYRDDGGNLILTIAGFSFIGAGTISLSGNLLSVVNGRIAKANKPS